MEEALQSSTGELDLYDKTSSTSVIDVTELPGDPGTTADTAIDTTAGVPTKPARLAQRVLSDNGTQPSVEERQKIRASVFLIGGSSPRPERQRVAGRRSDSLVDQLVIDGTQGKTPLSWCIACDRQMNGRSKQRVLDHALSPCRVS